MHRITPVYTRVPAVIATSSLAVNRVAPGRFALGLGSSTHTMVENWYGVPFEKPLTRVRETTELVRKLFAGEKTRYEGGTVSSRGFRLKEPIAGDIPIFLAGMGPKMLELAGEIADGVILNHFTPLDRVPWALECVDRGAKRSGRRVEDLEIAQRVAVWVTETTRRPASSSAPTSRSTVRPPSTATSSPGWAIRARRRRSRKGFEVRDRARIMAAAPDEAVERMYVWAIGRPAIAASGSSTRPASTRWRLPPSPRTPRLRRDLRGVPPRRLPPRRLTRQVRTWEGCLTSLVHRGRRE